MKKMSVRFALMVLALALALCATALADPSENLQKVYDALTADGSAFSQSAAMYAEYYEGVTMEAVLDDAGITIAVNSENEYVPAGSWTFTEEGNALTATIDKGDYVGSSMLSMLLSASAEAQGINSTLFNGYVSALTMTGLENKYFPFEEDEAAGTVKCSIDIVGPYELEGLEDMVLTEDFLKEQSLFEPLNDTYYSHAVNFGKISLIANGNADSVTFLVLEYGELDDKALAAVISAAKTLQPKGWEDFVASYTELKDAEEAGYTAVLNADEAAVKEIIEDSFDGYSAAIITVGEIAE